MIKLIISPCPNDTFIFHAWVHGLVPNAPTIEVEYSDIDRTNQWVTESGHADVMKISYAALPYVHPDYRLIHCGGAIGYGCGPLVVAKDDLAFQRKNAVIAVPSDRSTAFLLYRMWEQSLDMSGQHQIRIMPFEQIMPAVASGEVDAGLVIHEARFIYAQHGLTCLVDLGAWWEAESGLPLPLGAIVAKRTLDPEQLSTWIRTSVQMGWRNPDVSADYIRCHAQEMNDEVTRQHIALYVNEESAQISERGKRAIRTLFDRASANGWVDAVNWERHGL